METSKESAGVDKQGLWGWWHSSIEWQDALHKKAAHKALDIPEAEPVINSTNTTGVGWKELAVMGALIAGLVGVTQLNNTATPPTPVTQAAPPDAGYDIVFYDADGNQIQVDRWQNK